LTRDVTKACMD